MQAEDFHGPLIEIMGLGKNGGPMVSLKQDVIDPVVGQEARKAEAAASAADDDDGYVDDLLHRGGVQECRNVVLGTVFPSLSLAYISPLSSTASAMAGLPPQIVPASPDSRAPRDLPPTPESQKEKNEPLMGRVRTTGLA
jgi:hypothetical protein